MDERYYQNVTNSQQPKKKKGNNDDLKIIHNDFTPLEPLETINNDNKKHKKHYRYTLSFIDHDFTPMQS